MSLNFWPRVKVRQPTELKGQIYIPSVNTILWIGCVLMILYFQNSTHMEAAYGFSITIAMMMTTILLSYFMIYRKKWNLILVIGILMVFSTIEVSFFITNVVRSGSPFWLRSPPVFSWPSCMPPPYGKDRAWQSSSINSAR